MSNDKPDTGLVTASLMQRWQREFDRLGEHIKLMNKRRDALRSMISAGSVVMPDEEEPAQTPVEKKRRKLAKRVAHKGGGDVTWTGTIKDIVLKAKRQMSYKEVRDLIMETKLASRLEQSDKGFYGAIIKLADAGTLVRYKGHVFPPDVYREFEAKRAAGLVPDLKIANEAHRSPIGEAIKNFMAALGRGAPSGEIIAALRKNEEFAATVEKNKTHPYNVLARMVRAGELKKKGELYFSVTVAESRGGSTGDKNNGQLPLHS